MKSLIKSILVAVLLLGFGGTSPLLAQESLIAEFPIAANELTLHRLAQPGTSFIKAGRRFAVLGDESGTFEAWAYPLKLFRSFVFSFFVADSTHPILGKDIVSTIDVTPEATTLTYTYQSFTVKAIYVTPINEPGCFILLDVDTTEPLTIVCGFLPVLQPMWPAGLGGQYAHWDDTLKTYIISESTRKNHGIVGSPAASGITYTPAHMLSDSPNEFKIEITDPQAVRSKYVPIICAGGKGKREDVLKTYQYIQSNTAQLYQDNVNHFRTLRENTLAMKTPDPKLDLAFEWAKVVYDSLRIDNPDLGRGLIAGLGHARKERALSEKVMLFRIDHRLGDPEYIPEKFSLSATELQLWRGMALYYELGHCGPLRPSHAPSERIPPDQDSFHAHRRTSAIYDTIKIR